MTMTPRPSDPAVSAEAVITSDVTILELFRGLYVGSAGDVAILPEGNAASVTFVGVQAGTILPVRGTQVLATGTTATSILALR